MRHSTQFAVPNMNASKVSGARKRAGSLLVLCLVVLFALYPAYARAIAPQYTDIMPVSQIRPGMKGYGLTTFHGVTISRFSVTIIGVLKQANSGHDLILIRMKGGPITERGANLIHGMSGSPIYIGGKIIGAFSQGEQWPKEPVGMVTPIQDMLDAWDPNIPQRPAYFQPAQPARSKSAAIRLPAAIMIGSRRITSLVLSAPEGCASSSTTAALHNATSLLYAPGAKEANRIWLQHALEARGYHYTVVTDGGVGGTGGASTFHGAPLKPGSCFGTMLAEGDIPFGGYGTITYRRGDKVLGFGHPLMGLGALEGAITSAYVVDVFSGLQTSHLIPISGPIVGTLCQDRDFSVSGDLSSRPHLIPFDVTVNDATTHRSQTFHEHLLQHPELTQQLMTYVAKEAVSRVHDIPGDVMAHVTTTVEAAEIGTLTRTNTVYDSVDVSGPALMDLTEITGVVSGNPFYPLPIKSARIVIDIRSGHETATVDRIFLKQGKFEPGDTIEIGAVLKPYRQAPVTRMLTLKIPSDTPGGRYSLVVRGGMASVMRFGGMTFGSSGDTLTPPANARQMARQLAERETNTDLVAKVLLNTYVPAVEGVKLSQMPPNLAALMRSERNSGVRLEREELHTRLAVGCVVSGSQQLLVTVVRKNMQEAPTVGSPPTSSSQGNLPGTSIGLSPGGGNAGLLNGDVIDAASSVGANGTLAAGPIVASDYSVWLAALDGVPDHAGPVPQPTSQERPAADTPSQPQVQHQATAAPGFRVIEPDKAGATPTDGPPEKPVGRQPIVWRQSARTDLAAGKFYGAGVTAAGELRISPSLHRLTTSGETYIWSLVADSQGNLYAGTGTTGKILKINAAGQCSVFAELPVVTVQSLLLAHDGTLWAGTGAGGAIYHVAMDGKATLIRTLKERFVLALAEDSKGCLYIGAGGGGAIYRLTPSEQSLPKPFDPPTVYYQTQAQHIMALAVDSADNLLAGLAPEGILYRIGPNGRGAVLYDARENAIMAIAAGTNGDVYVATGPRGIVYAVHPDGSTGLLYDRAPNFYTALRAAPDGSLFASTATSVFHITPRKAGDPRQAVVVPLENPKDVDYLCLAVRPSGALAAGTGNVGEVFGADLVPSAQNAIGVYESVVRDAKLPSRWGTMRWEATIPAGAAIQVSTRTGDVAEPDGAWSHWSPVRATGAASEGAIVSPPARYIQYRMELRGLGSDASASPAIREVSVSYMSSNQPPRVAFVAPNGGERWAKTQTIRWSASDPDNDTLNYTLEYSADGGGTWRPVSQAGGKRMTDTQPSAVGMGSDSGALSDFEKQLDPSIPPFLRQIALDRHKNALANGAGGATASAKDSFRLWDTASVPDGTYILRVSASDRASNPIDSLTTVAISEPFIVCNSAPVIRIVGGPEVGTDKSISVRGVATQKLAAITAVQYRIDSGEWISATPDDGLFDSGREPFSFVTLPVSPGKHVIEVLCFNSAAERSSTKLDILAP